MSDCPSELVLLDYLRGELDDMSCRSVDEHLDHCPSCNGEAVRLEQSVSTPQRSIAGQVLQDSYLSEQGAEIALQRVLALARSCPDGVGGRSWHSKHVQLEAGDQIDDFLIIRNLGSGGFATVYLAQQKSLHRLVALKVSQRRSYEAPVLSNLDHPHIVRVYDERILSLQGLRLLYMQYVAGGSLKQVIERLGDIEPTERCSRDLRAAISAQIEDHGETIIAAPQGGLPPRADWVTAVCWISARILDALRYAHAKGYLHRDIKPANILLTADGRPLLADFNLSYGSAVEGAGPEEHFGGSYAYMSPEQLEVHLGEREASDVGPASDVYSLGIVIWELLTGERPQPNDDVGANRLGKLRALLEYRRSGTFAEHLPKFVPAHIGRILCSMLAPASADRPDAASLARAFQLNATPELRRLLAPAQTGWIGACASRPITSLVLCGLVPNAVIALVNICCNLNFLGDDPEQLKKNLLIVNSAVFSLGTALSIYYAWPLIRVLSQASQSAARTAHDLRSGAQRCFTLPSFVYALTLLLWICTGVAFPELSRRQTDDGPTGLEFSEFFTSQLVHGLIASSLTYLTVTLATMRLSFPNLVQTAPLTDFRGRLARMRVLADRHASLLGLIPSFALIAVALLRSDYFEHRDRGNPWLFVALGVFGAASFLLALAIKPLIRSTLDALQIALTPTMQLLYGESAAGPRMP